MGNTSDKEDNGEASAPNTPSGTRKSSSQHGQGRNSIVPTTTKILTSSQKDLIRHTWDSSKRTEICVRIYKRVFDKRPELKKVFDAMGEDVWMDEAKKFGEYVDSIVGQLDDLEEIERLSLEMGRRHGDWRNVGFKSEFWVIFAEAMTTECVYLDAGAHPTGDVLGAWGNLVTCIFGWVRDGYYEKLKLQRKLSRKQSRGGGSLYNKTYASRTNSSSTADENGPDSYNSTVESSASTVGATNVVYTEKRSPRMARRF